MKENQKSWPQKGDRYYFISDDLCICSDTITGKESPDKFHRQIVKLFVGNFFETFEEATEMLYKLMFPETVLLLFPQKQYGKAIVM